MRLHDGDEFYSIAKAFRYSEKASLAFYIPFRVETARSATSLDTAS